MLKNQHNYGFMILKSSPLSAQKSIISRILQIFQETEGSQDLGWALYNGAGIELAAVEGVHRIILMTNAHYCSDLVIDFEV